MREIKPLMVESEFVKTEVYPVLIDKGRRLERTRIRKIIKRFRLEKIDELIKYIGEGK
ncbi:MAG: hypothetical protein KAQ92_02985 [Candidatus Aenigmarchaeota archaeon]|nr:hypothetical protein [Candidatus Aenigmarchaeota archaeon]